MENTTKNNNKKVVPSGKSAQRDDTWVDVVCKPWGIYLAFVGKNKIFRKKMPKMENPFWVVWSGSQDSTNIVIKILKLIVFRTSRSRLRAWLNLVTDISSPRIGRHVGHKPHGVGYEA